MSIIRMTNVGRELLTKVIAEYVEGVSAIDFDPRRDGVALGGSSSEGRLEATAAGLIRNQRLHLTHKFVTSCKPYRGRLSHIA